MICKIYFNRAVRQKEWSSIQCHMTLSRMQNAETFIGLVGRSFIGECGQNGEGELGAKWDRS